MIFLITNLPRLQTRKNPGSEILSQNALLIERKELLIKVCTKSGISCASVGMFVEEGLA